MEVAQAKRIDPFLDEVKSKASDDYLVLADEVTERIKHNKSKLNKQIGAYINKSISKEVNKYE